MVPQSAEIRADSHTNGVSLFQTLLGFVSRLKTRIAWHREKKEICFSLHLAIGALQTSSSVIILKSVLKISFRP